MSRVATALLAVDASGSCGLAGVVVSVDGRCHARGLPGTPPRTEDLSAVTSDVLTLAGLGPEGLAAVAAVVGPGSYTGLRSALAFLRGLSLVDGLPAIGVDAHDLLAWRCCREGELAVACVRAGEGRVTLAAARRLADDVVRLADAEALSTEDLAGFLDRLRRREGMAPVLVTAADPTDGLARASAVSGCELRVAPHDGLADLATLSRSRLGRGLAVPCASLLPVYVGSNVARPPRSTSGIPGAEVGSASKARE